MGRRFPNLVFVAALAVTACGAPGPGGTVERYLDALAEGDIERAADLTFTEGDVPRAVILDGLAFIAAEFSSRSVSVSDFEILSVAVDGDKAEVQVSVPDPDGGSSTETIYLVTVDGRYKIDLDET